MWYQFATQGDSFHQLRFGVCLSDGSCFSTKGEEDVGNLRATGAEPSDVSKTEHRRDPHGSILSSTKIPLPSSINRFQMKSENRVVLKLYASRGCEESRYFLSPSDASPALLSLELFYVA